MGHVWSSRRRRQRHEYDDHHHHHQNPTPTEPPRPPSLPSSNPQPLPAAATLTPPLPPPPPSYVFAASAPYPARQHPSQNPVPMPPAFTSLYGARPTMFYNYQWVYNHQGNGWPGFRPPADLRLAQQPPPPYVDQHSAKKIKNDVYVRKDTIRLEFDDKNPEYYLVSFTFDAEVDGSITIFYFGKEGGNCAFTPLYPEIYTPVKIPFQKGLGQKFHQPSGTGVDLGFFDINDLSKPFPGDVFPLVISAESSSPSLEKEDHPSESADHAQITQAVLEKNDENHFQVKVIKQILWVDSVRYELREIYGINNANETTPNGSDSGQECVICMTEPKDTTVLPCRHLCMCSQCAKELSLQSDKCPICRQPIEELLEIKVNEDES